MSQSIELLKNVPITETILSLETLLSEVCEKIALEVDTENPLYSALSISGTPELSDINALTLDGHSKDYFATADHNHDSDYLGIDAKAVSSADSDLLNSQNAAFYLNWNNFTNTPATYTPSSHSHVVNDVTDIDTYLNSVSVSKTATEGQTVFSLTTEWPTNYFSLAVFRNGIYQLQGSDFSVNTGAKTITFFDDCEAGESIVVIFNTKLTIDVVEAHNHDDKYLQLTGGVISGNLQVTGSTSGAGKIYAGTNNPTNSTRLNYDGYFYATRVYNAVYNDVAECFIADENIIYEQVKNRIVQIVNGKVNLSNPYSYNSIGIVSDNYGFLIGGTEEEILNNSKIPVGLVGTLWVDSEDAVSQLFEGNFICAGKDGKARVISRGDSYIYDGKIVGKIIETSEVNNQYKVILCLK